MGTRLAGKVAIITGGSRGQGAATAKLFSPEGAQIMLAEVNAPDPSLIDSLDGSAHFMRHDVSDAAGWGAYYNRRSHTQFGPTLCAIGSKAEASRLAGIVTKRYPPAALSICAVCSAIGGVMVSSTLGAGRPENIRDPYLLNASASVFIGASTLRPGRFHILGTMVDILHDRHYR
jgi:NAD(P)-dependent dehydrogenase (short-subunit alcohol dehydrogenase family)